MNDLYSVNLLAEQDELHAMVRRAQTESQGATMHPIFEAIARDVQSLPILTARIQRDAYVTMLKRMDWSFELSDDQTVWRKGREALAELRLLQRELDPSGTVWNEHTPANHKIKP